MIFGVEGVDPDRRKQLIQLLDIDLYQRLCTMSDGQKRRVQICMGLLKPYDVSAPPPIPEHIPHRRRSRGRRGAVAMSEQGGVMRDGARG